MKLKTKMIGSFLVVGIVVLIVGAIGWYGVRSQGEISQQMNYLGNINKQLLQREIDHLNWARKVGQFQRDENMKELSVEKDAHKCAFGKWYYSEERKKAEKDIPEIKELLRQIEEPHNKLHDSAKELEKILQKGKESRQEAIQFYGTETSQQLRNVQGLLSEITPKVDQYVTLRLKDAQDQSGRITLLSVIFMVAGTFFAVILGIFISRSITRPINTVVEGLTAGADQVASASSQVSSASQSLAEGASEQAAGLEETSSSMEEMSSMTRQNAGNATQANTLMTETSKVVEAANQSMSELTGSMNEITQASEETGKIIKTIDEIAFQTNLLALNAAVEAARAGDAGAGFAVVANEVRNLAMRAAEAAKNTSDLIEDTVKKVKKGSAIVARTNEAFKKVATGSKKAGELVGEIAAASQEQAQGIEQVSKAVSEMDRVVQQNAANAEESASAAEEMNAQAEQMKEYVNQLASLVEGQTNGNGSSPRGVLPRPSRIDGLKMKPRKSLAGQRKQMANRDLLVPSRKEVRPEQVIPLNDDDFKEF